MNKFEENKFLQEEIKSKRTELEILERKLKKLGNCYIILSNGLIGEQPIDFFHWTTNVDCYYQGNLFDSKEDAELEVKRRNLLTRFRAFRDECNGDWKADFTICDNKYFIEKRSGKTDVNYICTVNAFILFGYFKNYEDAERAIELFGGEINELFVEKRLANENN